MIDSLWVDYALCIYKWRFVVLFLFLLMHSYQRLVDLYLCVPYALFLFSGSSLWPHDWCGGCDILPLFFSCLPDVAVAESCET